METDYNEEIILGLPKSELMDFIGLKDDSEESITNALLTQIGRLVEYVIERLLDDSKHPIQKIGSFYTHDSFGITMRCIFSEEYFTIKELFMDDVVTLMLKILNEYKSYIDEECGKNSSLYIYNAFDGDCKELLGFILDIKEILFDTIYFNDYFDYDFDTEENPYSDILFNIQAITYIADYENFTSLGIKYQHIILEHFKKLYNMENKLILNDDVSGDRDFIRHKLLENRMIIVELIVHALLKSSTDFE